MSDVIIEDLHNCEKIVKLLDEGNITEALVILADVKNSELRRDMYEMIYLNDLKCGT